MIRPQAGPVSPGVAIFRAMGYNANDYFPCKEENAMKAKVCFSREITPEKVVALYRAVGRELPGKVAVKLHSGE